MTAPARRAAWRVLREVHTGRTDLSHAHALVRTSLNDPRDRALATEISTGTLRWRAELDHVIQQLSSRPIRRIDADVLDLLRLSTYQLLHLHRVPAHAVVNDAVNLSRGIGKQSAAPYVNAILRALRKTPPPFTLPRRPTASPATKTPSTEVLDYLSITLSHPRWLVERWYGRHGFEAAERWAQFDNEPPPITLRVNTLVRSAGQLAEELSEHGVETTPGQWTPNALVVTRGNPLATPLAPRGLFWIQDEASQLVAEQVGARPGDRVLDVCASPGGKSLVTACAMENRGLLVTGDLRPRRIDLLRRTVAPMGPEAIQVIRLDGRDPPFGSVFDRVLVDVPCSGLGTLRRDPDIRWRRTEEDLNVMATLQLALLAGASTTVAPGGDLLYATCSSEPEENQDTVYRFLETHRDFALVSPSVTHLRDLVDPHGFFQTLPPRDGLEAFFAARLRRKMS